VSDPVAVAVARAAREWNAAGIARRLRALARAGADLAVRRDELHDALRADGHSLRMARYWADWILRVASPSLLERYARALVRWEPIHAHDAAARGGELLVRRADGVVLVVTPASAPTINASSLFSILLPGNGVIVRAPEHDVGTRFLVEKVIHPALAAEGFSTDLAQVVTGKSRDVMGRFIPAPEVQTVVFFGNAEAGREVARQSYASGKKVVLELEGSDSMVVWRDAPVARAVESALRAFHASTQPCPVPKHFLVHAQVFDRFVEAMASELPRVSTVAADPERGVLVPVARPEGYFAALDELRAIPEARVLGGARRIAADGTPDERGAFLSPTLVTLPSSACRAPLRCFDDEIYFPLLPIVRFDGDDETIAGEMAQLLSRSPFGLRVSVWTHARAVIERMAREISTVGILIFNDDHARAPEVASPWGGPRRSGGPHGENHFFWEKTSRLQAILCHDLSVYEVRRLLDALGALPMEGL